MRFFNRRLQMKHGRWIILAIVYAAVSGCANTVEPTQTPIPQSPTPTTTLQVSRTFLAPPVLIELYSEPAIFGTAANGLPTLVLYSDGQMILGYAGGSQIRKAVLTTKEVCELLRGIEQDGFFDFADSEYVATKVEQHSITHITVKSWRQRSFSGVELERAIFFKGSDGKAPPALERTYNRLKNYLPKNTEPYLPERIALYIAQFDRDDTQPWDKSLLPLKELLQKKARVAYDEPVALEGKEASAIFNFMKNKWDGFFQQDGLTYRVEIVPLLPLRNPAYYYRPNAYAFNEEPKTEMDCTNN